MFHFRNNFDNIEFGNRFPTAIYILHLDITLVLLKLFTDTLDKQHVPYNCNYNKDANLKKCAAALHLLNLDQRRIQRNAFPC